MSVLMDRAYAATKTYEDTDVAGIFEALESLKAKRANLFGVEMHSREAMEKKIDELTTELKLVELWRSIGLPKIDEQVLTWRCGTKLYKNKWYDTGINIPIPSFALTNLIAPETSFVMKGEWWSAKDYRITERYISPHPFSVEKMNHLYGDVISALEKLSMHRNGRKVELTTNYHGVIPDDVRTQIAVSDFELNEVFLLREVPKTGWSLTVKQAKRPPQPRHWDPLVVGVRESAMWLITDFQPTPLEEYVKHEFAVLEQGWVTPELTA